MARRDERRTQPRARDRSCARVQAAVCAPRHPDAQRHRQWDRADSAAGVDRRTSGDAHRRTPSVGPGGVSRSGCRRLDRYRRRAQRSRLHPGAGHRRTPDHRTDRPRATARTTANRAGSDTSDTGDLRPTDATRSARTRRDDGGPQRRGDRPGALRGSDHRPITDPIGTPEARRPVTACRRRPGRRPSEAAVDIA